MANVYLDPENAHARMAYAWKLAGEILKLGKRVKVTVSEYRPTRSLVQNDLMWKMLSDISAQLQWPVDGKLSYLPEEDWKDVLSSGLKKEQRIAQGIAGGFVMLGQRTSKMKVSDMSDLIDLMGAFGAEHGVEWKV